MKSLREQIIENYEREIEECSTDLLSGAITDDEYDATLARLREIIKKDLAEIDNPS
jgi:hypothetical protein